MDQSMDQLVKHTTGMGQLKMFSKDWYNEYFRLAANSPTHSHFCEQVYGQDLCQHGMMDMEELGFLISILKPNEKILEIGCSNGHITEYLQKHTTCNILGIDYSDVAITQARNRTRDKRAVLDFQCVDLIEDDIPGEDYNTILAIDSIYFMGDYKTTLAKLNTKLGNGGHIIIAAFQVKEENDPDSILLSEHTDMAKALQTLSFSYTQHEFTTNVRNHWIKNYQFSQALESKFISEGNKFLYQARMAENGWFKAHAEQETLVRFMYIVDYNPDVA